MDYVTQYYKNLSEQLQQRVNILTRKVKYLTEAEATPGPTDGGKGGQSPFTPGGYFYPSQLNPPQFTPNPKPIPYRGPGPVKPGHYVPAPPPTAEEWLKDNPPPNPDNYPVDEDGNGGPNNPQFIEDAREWQRLRHLWWQSWQKWKQENAGGAGQGILPGPGVAPGQMKPGLYGDSYPQTPDNWPPYFYWR